MSELSNALAAGDVIAHQLLFRDHGEILERWWKSRGGHGACTVCNVTPSTPAEPLSSGDAIACIGMALQNPDTDEWPQLLRDCMHVIERMEDELLEAKRQRNDESRLRQAAERAAQVYTLRGWVSPNPGCAELADHDGGGWEPVYSRNKEPL
jgi:hypothetical protein